MNETIIMPAPVLSFGGALQGKWEREYAAFRRLLPQLLVSHRGKFVAIHGEEVVASGDNKLAIALDVLAKVGNVDIHVGLVTDGPEPAARSGVGREMRVGGGDV